MMRAGLPEAVMASRLVGVMRGIGIDRSVDVAEAARAGGVVVFEVTMDSPGQRRRSKLWPPWAMLLARGRFCRSMTPSAQQPPALSSLFLPTRMRGWSAGPPRTDIRSCPAPSRRPRSPQRGISEQLLSSSSRHRLVDLSSFERSPAPSEMSLSWLPVGSMRPTWRRTFRLVRLPPASEAGSSVVRISTVCVGGRSGSLRQYVRQMYRHCGHRAGRVAP
jgi:hypothetical protein